MELLGRYSAWLEVYSIDEAFLGVKGTPDELLALGRTMKTAVRRNVGVPVCVGIAAHEDPGEAGQQMGQEQPGLRRRLPLGLRARRRQGSADAPACP